MRNHHEVPRIIIPIGELSIILLLPFGIFRAVNIFSQEIRVGETGAKRDIFGFKFFLKKVFVLENSFLLFSHY